mmetsp:Transcript_9159/g.15920  ORF Transcript_9159/g.15920 Transcript_9159/m.15920 type:complete len:200 (+) Transcript_9159:191-790(+)
MTAMSYMCCYNIINAMVIVVAKLIIAITITITITIIHLQHCSSSYTSGSLFDQTCFSTTITSVSPVLNLVATVLATPIAANELVAALPIFLLPLTFTSPMKSELFERLSSSSSSNHTSAASQSALTSLASISSSRFELSRCSLLHFAPRRFRTTRPMRRSANSAAPTVIPMMAPRGSAMEDPPPSSPNDVCSLSVSRTT